MTYSVWNQGDGLFDYYETATPQREVNVEPPTHLRGGRQMGATPEEAAWPLPAAAKRVGQGPLARGRIATSHRRALGAFAMDSGLFTLGALGLGAFVVWKYVLQK